jgi:hypothetical protein
MFVLQILKYYDMGELRLLLANNGFNYYNAYFQYAANTSK